MQDKKMEIAILVTDAAKKHLRLKTFHDLDERIGVHKGSVSLWRSRDGIPIRHHDFFIEKCNIKRDWLKTGEGEMFNKQPQPQPLVLDPSIALSFLDPRLMKIINLWDSICQQQRDTLLSVAQGFAKQPPETSPENEEQEPDYCGKKSA